MVQLRRLYYFPIHRLALFSSTDIFYFCLAYAELFTTFAYLFRKFDLEISELLDMIWIGMIAKAPQPLVISRFV